ncbi:type 4 pilus major pilin [Pusillimonas noertemannii]|uniref:Prepilin-type N-terminal cleavage/methylation domain-containing protein n=1 Tax=Pusillimonas noertemannii TaxID=305977 RepID=A0A2U1CKC5_9BURK|nr:type 4 pilus major pilin [Pusillimonas noertemannii]NYT69606.1 prepilin-type N-terminal cleavage/methylation domain-containing protein [Pusillimonas noertemannii]PVY61470.1 prepilin-type N-terminal cleavage/methylation domain-containing protein [Pusillimonas noertemannii]TFL08934.1 prepilin-type N-terminal cleavage/methylation domain-containing protein [Pusillimonas noertemannii]
MIHAFCNADRQRGFSLVEVSIVTAIVLLLAIIGIPAIGSYVVENKVPKAGEELARFILQTKVNAPNGTSLPYAAIETAHFASLARDSSVFSVVGADAAARVLHGLGSEGEVTVQPADSGAAFSIGLSRVHHAACPSLASILQRVSDVITLTPDGGGAVVVKDATTSYSALAVETQCVRGDANDFLFTVS